MEKYHWEVCYGWEKRDKLKKSVENPMFRAWKKSHVGKSHGEKIRFIVFARIASSASRAATRQKSDNELLRADMVEFHTASRFTNLQRPLGRPSPGDSMLRSQWLMVWTACDKGRWYVADCLVLVWHSHLASEFQNWAYSLGDFSLDKVGASGRCLNLRGKVRGRIITGPERWFSSIDCTV